LILSLRRLSSPLVPTLLAAAGLCGAALASHAAEPPALPQPPVPSHHYVEPPQRVLDLSLQAAWSALGDWGAAITDLESRSRSDGLPIATSNRPAYTLSFEAAVLMPVRDRWLAGLQYDRPTGKSEFSVRDDNGGTGGTGEFKTSADANSNAYLAVVRWLAPTREGAVHTYFQAGAGVGSARLEFSTPSGSALGKGHGFVGSLEAGAMVGDGPLRLRTAVGARFHHVKLGYSRVSASSQAGLRRYYFDFNDELADFARGRDLDLGGVFARIGAAFSFSR
jgi:hypothetical protein